MKSCFFSGLNLPGIIAVGNFSDTVTFIFSLPNLCFYFALIKQKFNPPDTKTLKWLKFNVTQSSNFAT